MFLDTDRKICFGITERFWREEGRRASWQENYTLPEWVEATELTRMSSLNWRVVVVPYESKPDMRRYSRTVTSEFFLDDNFSYGVEPQRDSYKDGLYMVNLQKLVNRCLEAAPRKVEQYRLTWLFSQLVKVFSPHRERALEEHPELMKLLAKSFLEEKFGEPHWLNKECVPYCTDVLIRAGVPITSDAVIRACLLHMPKRKRKET